MVSSNFPKLVGDKHYLATVSVLSPAATAAAQSATFPLAVPLMKLKLRSLIKRQVSRFKGVLTNNMLRVHGAEFILVKNNFKKRLKNNIKQIV